jgi:hypothetical protein
MRKKACQTVMSAELPHIFDRIDVLILFSNVIVNPTLPRVADRLEKHIRTAPHHVFEQSSRVLPFLVSDEIVTAVKCRAQYKRILVQFFQIFPEHISREVRDI